jgi:hypothetical protein
MLWWFLILAASAAVVVSVSVALYLQVRRQMKRTSSGQKAEIESARDQPPNA